MGDDGLERNRRAFYLTNTIVVGFPVRKTNMEDFDKFINHINKKNTEIRAALEYLITAVEDSGEFKLVPHWRGGTKNNIDLAKNENLHFAFIVNINKPILFYVKAHEIDERLDEGQTKEQVIKVLEKKGFEVNGSGKDLTVRLRNKRDAEHIVEFIYRLNSENCESDEFQEGEVEQILEEGVTKPDKFDEKAEMRYLENASSTKYVTIGSRSRNAREDCIAHHGCRCHVSECGFDFEETYGEVGKGYTHVHHLKELALIDGEYLVDPIEDLRPVCANCHAMLHKKTPAYTIEELQEIIKTLRENENLSSDSD